MTCGVFPRGVCEEDRLFDETKPSNARSRRKETDRRGAVTVYYVNSERETSVLLKVSCTPSSKGTMGPFPHRLPVHPSHDRTTLEEIMLARKIMLDDPHECPAAESSTKRGGVLATPPCLASCVSRLPPEAYTKAVSSRLGKRPRSRLLRRAKPSTDNIIIPNRDGFSRISRDQHYQQQLRPLTGVSPPSTAPQDTFSLIDYFAEGTSRPVVRLMTPYVLIAIAYRRTWRGITPGRDEFSKFSRRRVLCSARNVIFMEDLHGLCVQRRNAQQFADG